MDKNTSWTLREHCQMEEKALSEDRVSFVERSESCQCVYGGGSMLYLVFLFKEEKVNTFNKHYNCSLTCWQHILKGFRMCFYFNYTHY